MPRRLLLVRRRIPQQRRTCARSRKAAETRRSAGAHGAGELSGMAVLAGGSPRHGVRQVPRFRVSSRSSPGRSAQRTARTREQRPLPAATLRCVRKFRRFYPGGFEDADYIAAERDYKENAHQRWQSLLGQPKHRALNQAGAFQEVAATAVRIESRTNLLFSFEKMAVRDAVRSPK